jgi:hypothetical protein
MTATDLPTTTTDPPPDPDLPEVPEPLEGGVYPAEIVQGLRHEAADKRRKARDADTRAEAAEAKAGVLTERLLTASLARHAPGLADPSDLLAHVPVAELVDEAGLPDPAKIVLATQALLVKKPHLASRRPTGAIDQGARTTPPEQVDFADILRGAVR